ncbi:MAG: PD-(D/E)XK nuclease family protein, partial [Candidatus Thermoplasmatota archaeon]|nr:PD-(D/E)XK nuclease family protein [Candidatus Thermoplasmatota archaeon]
MNDLEGFKFSYTALETYHACPYRFKMVYLTKRDKRPGPIEPFMGVVVHASLQWLYNEISGNHIPSSTELLAFYDDLWDKKKEEKTVFVNHDGVSEKDFKDLGAQILNLYHLQNEPFDRDETLFVEKELKMTTEGGNVIYGVIDRIAQTNGRILIIDYKTSKTSMTFQSNMEHNRQMRFYRLLVDKNKDIVNPDRIIESCLYLLRLGRSFFKTYSTEDIQQFEQEIDGRIQRMKEDTSFAPSTNPFCGICAYAKQCH